MLAKLSVIAKHVFVISSMGKCTHVLQAEELATRRNSIRPPCSKLRARRGRPPGRQGPARTLEDRDLPGGVAPTIASRRAVPHRRPDQRRTLPQFLAPTPKPTTSWWPTIWDLTRKSNSQSDQGSRRARLLFLPGTCPTQPYRAGLPKPKNARPKGGAPRTFSTPPRTPSQCALGGKVVYCPQD